MASAPWWTWAVAPGMDHLFLGTSRRVTMNGRVVRVLSSAGCPRIEKWPFAYKAPFSPVDVIEEYMRPARYRENGHLVTKSAPCPTPSSWSSTEVGTLGSLQHGRACGRCPGDDAPHPEHEGEDASLPRVTSALIQALKQSGFFDTGADPGRPTPTISPLEFHLQDPDRRVGPGAGRGRDHRSCALRSRGEEDGSSRRPTSTHLHDEYDAQTASVLHGSDYRLHTAPQPRISILRRPLHREGCLPRRDCVGKAPALFRFHAAAHLAAAWRGLSYDRAECIHLDVSARPRHRRDVYGAMPSPRTACKGTRDEKKEAVLSRSRVLLVRESPRAGFGPSRSSRACAT